MEIELNGENYQYENDKWINLKSFLIPDLITISTLNKLLKEKNPDFTPKPIISKSAKKHQKTDAAIRLNELWQVGAKHPLYREDGKFYNLLKDFPGALFDPNGYILFKTKKEYKDCTHLNIGKRINLRKPISEIPGYIRKTK